MTLHKWLLNCKGLEDVICQTADESMPHGHTEHAKVLKIVWEENREYFTFNPFILQGSARIFNSSGLLSSFVIRVKVLLWKLWEFIISSDQYPLCDLC